MILSTAHGLLAQAERVQAEQVAAARAINPDDPGTLVADDGYVTASPAG